MMPDNKTGKPLEYYRAAFAQAVPAELSARSGIAFGDGAFKTTFLSKPVSILWPDMTVVDDGGRRLSPAVHILLGRLLLEGTVSPGSGRFLAYRELPWGSVYNAQFTGRCIRRFAASYGARLADFCLACEGLRAQKISGADAAYEIEFLPGLNVRLYIWEGDEEFPASAQMLFSDNFSAAFTAEDIAVAGDLILNALKGRY